MIPRTEAESKQYRIGNVTFEVILFDKAHTATELTVYVVDDSVLFTTDIINNPHFFMGHGDFKGAYAATQKALAINTIHVVVGHGRSVAIELVRAFAHIYQTLAYLVRQYCVQGLMDFEMKPMVVTEPDAYKDWSTFDRQISLYISQLIIELENQPF